MDKFESKEANSVAVAAAVLAKQRNNKLSAFAYRVSMIINA